MHYTKWHMIVVCHGEQWNSDGRLLEHQTLSLGRKSGLIYRAVNSSKQAIRIRSGVAGLSRGNHS